MFGYGSGPMGLLSGGNLMTVNSAPPPPPLTSPPAIPSFMSMPNYNSGVQYDYSYTLPPAPPPNYDTNVQDWLSLGAATAGVIGNGVKAYANPDPLTFLALGGSAMTMSGLLYQHGGNMLNDIGSALTYNGVRGYDTTGYSDAMYAGMQQYDTYPGGEDWQYGNDFGSPTLFRPMELMG